MLSLEVWEKPPNKGLGETKGNVGAVEVGVIAAVTVVEVKVVSEDFSTETGVMKDGNWLLTAFKK